MTHTPGPWHRNIRPATKYPTIFAGVSPHHVHVAHVTAHAGNEETAEANCDLIVAAPDMLAALTLLMDDFGDHFAGPTIDAARAAIAKAKGNG